MKQSIFTVLSNENIARGVFKMRLSGDTQDITRAGQFVNIKLDGFFLRRPISVCDCNENSLLLIYKVVGGGSEKLSKIGAGEKLDVLSGLGNGFDISKCGDKPLLVGGGVGTPPLYLLAKKLVALGKKPKVVLGFAGMPDVFFEEEFAALGADVSVATADGSYGKAGFVTDALDENDFSYSFACGPIPMLRALYDTLSCDGQYSFEERMGCGFGACMGCSCKTKYGNKRICKDGPVLEKGEIIW